MNNNEREEAIRSEIEKAKREKLKREKPLAFEKILKINEREAAGISTPIIDIAYSYVCNLHCHHCAANRMKKKDRRLTPADLRRLSDEADSLGYCQFVISGGEPLLFKDLDEVIVALQPEKFHIAMSTNGHFMSREKARHLKLIGLDKVKISLDDFDEKLHNQNRGCDDAYRKALNAMEYCKDAGMSVVIQTVVTHQNCRTDRTVRMAEFAESMGYGMDVLVAKAIGQWEGKHEVLIDEEDAKFLWEVHQKYPALHRDTFPAFGMEKGCGCINSQLHITEYGDALPCVMIHISLGNIFEESLADIMRRGESLKPFACRSKICLSGEDRNFINKYMTKFYGKPLPLDWREAFTEEDFL